MDMQNIRKDYLEASKQLEMKEGTYITDDEIWSIIIKKSMKKDDVINTLLGLIH